ncbi:MAG: FAD-dependent oxidoreductase [Deltaproteobacteria bacterium]|nr:FAD-dependent oxidoreductase [Deltaproteobacteria bacterium]
MNDGAANAGISERWDSFCFQFPNWTIELPGYKYQCDDPEAFAPGREVVRFIEDYAAYIKAPTRCGVEVASLERTEDSSRYLLTTNNGAIEAANVVIATGPYQLPVIPAMSAHVPNNILQVHSNAYRNPAQLPPGAVLVVGSGASGCQIADDLQQSGHRVYLSVGRHSRTPRRYRGQDFAYWGAALKRPEQIVDTVPINLRKGAEVLLTGANGGYDVDLRSMAARGIVLLGHLQGIQDGALILADDLEQNLAKGDESLENFKKAVDDYVTNNGLEAPEEREPEVNSNITKEISIPVSHLNLKDAGVSGIVWATGFRYDFDWVKLPIFDDGGEPVHRRGVTQFPGIYFLGLRWLYKRKSAFLLRASGAEDATYLAEQIIARN